METEFFTGHPQPYSRPLRQIAVLIAQRGDDASCVAEISALLRQYGIAVDHE